MESRGHAYTLMDWSLLNRFYARVEGTVMRDAIARP
jgi:hypothetical protein